MADKTIVELDAIETIDSADCLPIVDVSLDETYKISLAQLYAQTLSSVEKKLVIDITQTGTEAPTGVERYNSITGTPVLARTDVGIYTLTLTGKFTANKTDCYARDMTDIVSIVWTDVNTITVTTNGDDVLTGRRIIIEVYP